MSIETFFTTQATSPSLPNPAAKQAGNAVSIQGMDFLNMLLVGLLQTPKTDNLTPVKAEEHTPLESDNPLLAKDPSQNIAELLAATPAVEEDVKDLIAAPASGVSTQDQILQTLLLNQKAFDQQLSPGTDINTVAIGKDGKPITIANAFLIDTEKDKPGLLNKLSLILGKLEQLTANPGKGGLAISNLTPEQITNFKSKLNALLAKQADNQAETQSEKAEDDKDIADIILGLIRILPPQARPELIVLPQGLLITPRPLSVQQPAESANAIKPANDHMASLNPLATEASETAETGFEDTSPSPVQPDEDFKALLKEFSGKKDNGTDLSALLATKSDSPVHTLPVLKPNFSVLQGWPFSSDGSFLTTDASGLEGLSPLPASISGSQTLTNLATQAPSATLAHPAVNIVAATIQKSAAEGMNKSITLQLEPPELGHVEIRMSFGKDKAIKAVVSTERGETLGLLQRDAHILERVLHDAGLDTGGGISFELAADGHFFGNNGGHDGSGGHAGNNSSADADDSIIQSTMTWQVDPDTGHVRYDILV